MIELGMSTASFYPVFTENAAREIVKLGYKKAEVFLNSECEFEFNFIKELKKIFDDGGVDVVSVHPYTSAIESLYFFTQYPRRAEDAIEKYRMYFERAEMLGAKYFTLHGDRNLYRKIENIDMNLHIDVLNRLADVALEYGIIITQENVSWCVSENPEYIKMLKEKLGNKIGFTLDVKQAYRAKRDLYEYMTVMGDRLLNVHISDNNSESSCLLPCFGTMNYEKFIKKLEEISYNGALICEVYSTAFDDIRQVSTSKERLMSILSKL